MRLAAFERRMRRRALDTTLWARFAQPSVMLHARDLAVRDRVRAAITEAFKTAAWWAARLAPEGANAEETWTALFQQTYAAELRVEGAGRATAIVANETDLYAACYEMIIRPVKVSERDRARARRGWALRRFAGKALNFARLIKAAFTFRGSIAYALSKVERHSGRPFELAPWERRLP